MKVIDLLNKIANGEEIPRTIKIKDEIWKHDGTDYRASDDRGYLFEIHTRIIELDLNEEVEIIEEDKKIENMIKLNNISNPSDITALSTMQWENNRIIEKKINEIIDVINKGD